MDIIIIVIFIAASLMIGIWSGRNIKTLDHFSVGDRSFSSFVIFATLSASFIGGGYTLGNASKVYSTGMLYAFALLGFSVKEILVATFIAPRMGKYHDCVSIGDIIGRYYGRYAKIGAGVFSVIVCAGILGAQVGAMGAVFKTFFHINVFWSTIVGFSVIILYSTIGGMRAVVYTDVLQFLVLVVGVPLTFFVGVHYIGGWHVLASKVPTTHLLFLSNSHKLFMFVSLFIAFMLGETLVPPYVQRLFMTKTPKQTVRATLASGLLSIPFFLIAGGIGLVALVLNPHLNPNQAFPYVVKTVMPGALRGIVIAGVVAIIMSSASSFLNAASVAFTNDIVKPLSRRKLSQETLLKYAKLSTVVVGIGSVCFAFSIKNILEILLHAYNFWAPIILVPLVAVIMDVKVQPKDFFVAAIGGTISVLVWTILLDSPYHISGIVIGVLGNLICFMVSRKIGEQG